MRFQMADGRIALLMVTHRKSDRGGDYAVVRLLGPDDGGSFDIKKYPHLPERDPIDIRPIRNYVICEKKPDPRVSVMLSGVPVPDNRRPIDIEYGWGSSFGPATLFTWDEVDVDLTSHPMMGGHRDAE